MKTILSFCSNCGVLLRPKESPCENCLASTLERASRIEGEFDTAEANQLIAITFATGE
jgi:uncharacterized OB-fold protein